MNSISKKLSLILATLLAAFSTSVATAKSNEKVVLSCMPAQGEKYLVSIIKNFDTDTYQIMVASRIKAEKFDAEKKQSDRVGGETRYIAKVPGGRWILTINTTTRPSPVGRPATLSSQVFGQVNNTSLVCEQI